MSIDDRLRAGLTAHTAALTPAVEDELGALGHRLHRRRQVRIAVGALAVVSAVAAAALGASGAVQSLREGPVPSGGHSVPVPDPTPTPMSVLRRGSAVTPGTYTGTFEASARPDALPLAVVRVPAGYLAEGPGELASDTDVNGSGFRHLALWSVSEVAEDPCAGPLWTDPGPTARDLADALAALPVWRSTAPEPVTIGGYDGFVMDFDVPDPIPARCGSTLNHWKDDVGGVQGIGPGKRQRLWILDVAGERVMVLAGWFPRGVSDPAAGTTPAQADELVRMAEGITFVLPAAATR